MTATSLIESLSSRGMSVRVAGDAIKVSPASALTDDERQAIRDHKAELLEMLRPKTADRPRLGSFARPMPVRGTRMPADGCLWGTCDGSLTARGHNRYLCSDCGTWFELLPPADLGVFVGDLVADIEPGDAVHFGGATLYRTKGCGLVRAEAITPIAVSTWRSSEDPSANYDSIKQPLTFAKPDKPFFDADEWRSRKPKTERDFYKDRTQRTREWLRDVLKDGPLPAVAILRRAKRDDVPERGLRRAKRRLGILSLKRGGYHGRKGAVWVWATPQQATAANITP